MIVTEEKPFEEIKKYLSGYRRIAIFGCGSCATLSKTGGEEEVEALFKKLENEGFKVGVKTIIETACHKRLAAREIRKKQIENAEAAVVLSCGSGVQNIAEIAEIDVFPGLNTMFIGRTERPGIFVEFCSACGECVLGYTGGFCPRTRCPKSMLNGPCGGMVKGKCEVNMEEDCVWVLINKNSRGKKFARRINSMDKNFSNLKPRRINNNETTRK